MELMLVGGKGPKVESDPTHTLHNFLSRSGYLISLGNKEGWSRQ
jgi:hypothetical protein